MTSVFYNLSNKFCEIKNKKCRQQLQPAFLFHMVILENHDGTYEAEDGVELRKGGVDEGVGEHIVSL